MTVPSDPAATRLTAILADAALPTALAPALHRLLDLLASDPTAPTTVTEPRRAADVHVADSLAALKLPEVSAAAAIVDLGSGAGFPGLPLALALPAAQVLLLDAAARKVEFLERAIAAVGAGNAAALHGRAEELPAVNAGLGGRQADLVVARAVGPLPVVLEYAAPLLAIGGAAVVWRGRREPQAEAEAESATQELGFAAGRVHAVRPFKQAEHRHLHVYIKVMETPPRFPRRPGIARKRPLAPPPRSRSTVEPGSI